MAISLLDYVATLSIVFGVMKLCSTLDVTGRFFEGLQMVLPPADEDVAKMYVTQPKRGKKKALIPKGVADKIPIKLLTVNRGGLYQAVYYENCETLLTLGLAAIVHSILAEIFSCFGTDRARSYSFYVLQVALIYGIYTLLKTALATGMKSAEFRISWFFAVVSTICAYLLLSADQQFVDLQVRRGAEDIINHLQHGLRQLNKDSQSTVPVDAQLLVWLVALLAGGLTLAIVTPVMRYVSSYQEKLVWKMHQEGEDTEVDQSKLHLHFLIPLFVALMWINPVARDLLSGFPIPFETLRVYGLLVACILRSSLLRSFVQTFLRRALLLVISLPDTLTPGMVEYVKRKVRVTNSYVAVVATQHIASIIIPLCLAIAYKQKADISYMLFPETVSQWFSSVLPSTAASVNSTAVTEPHVAIQQAAALLGGNVESYLPLLNFINEFSTHMPSTFLAATLSFLCFWFHAMWFTFSCAGIVYLRQYPGHFS